MEMLPTRYTTKRGILGDKSPSDPPVNEPRITKPSLFIGLMLHQDQLGLYLLEPPYYTT